MEQIVKGGICWVELSIGRTSKGLEVWVKAVPEIEQFCKAQSDSKKDGVEVYARGWISDKPLEAYRFKANLAEQGYSLIYVGGSLDVQTSEDGRVNLSFLRLVGISEPEGVKFTVAGPFSREYLDRIGQGIIQQLRTFVRDYIVPVQVNLRISSTEI